MDNPMHQSDGIAWGVAENIGRIVLKRQEHANTISRAASRALVGAIDSVLEQQPRVVLLAAEAAFSVPAGILTNSWPLARPWVRSWTIFSIHCIQRCTVWRRRRCPSSQQ